MAVMTTVQKTSEGEEIFGKKQAKSHYKTRPITATLEYPLILDIKLLKKLDMTTFTKKGLIALSKFCGISLINKKETKKKLSKIKTVQYSKKQFGSEFSEHPASQIGELNKSYRTKRKFGKPVGKTKPRIRFKMAKEDSSPDEDSLDVVCKKHDKVSKTCTQTPNSRADDKKCRRSIIDTILNGTIENIIPEPCKTCSRSEQPERFHSHPKVLVKLSSGEKKLEEKFRDVVTTKDTGKEMRKNPCAKERSLRDSPCDDLQKTIPDKFNFASKSPTKSNSSASVSSPETGNKIASKTLRKPPSSSTNNTKGGTLKKANSKPEVSQKEEKIIPAEEDLKFVTGCYICGKQVSPKLRIKHEQTCILEWRTRNSLVSPDKRKAEPKRPDYRFTATGELDCEGTFESIWANHMDSLVPCKRCGRKFFPDRIERHENCCNNLPISIKYKH